jgi:hypothetical protein
VIGSAVKCDECGKVDVHESSAGSMGTVFTYKWFRVTAPQTVSSSQPTKVTDICSLKCLQSYSEGWTASA